MQVVTEKQIIPWQGSLATDSKRRHEEFETECK